jgi:hypothetical protein
VAPVGTTRGGAPLCTLAIELPEGRRELSLARGDLLRLPLAAGSKARASIRPARGVDVGAGPGQPLECELHGGEAGLILDGRGRPIELPKDPRERVAALERWAEALDLYPKA